MTRHREKIYEMNGIRFVDGLTQDLRYAFRQLRHGPGFSAVVVGTLALGIGGTTAVFSVMHAVLLAPLPYAQPDQIVRIYQEEPGKPDTRRAVSAPQFRMVREEAVSFADLGARYIREDLGVDLSKDGDGQRLRILMVTSDYFRTPLRSEQFRGPGFQIEDEKAGARREDRSGARRVVLSNTVWRARFNGDPSLVGTTIRMNAEPYEVAGIAPAGFQDPIAGAVDAWLPYDLDGDTLSENNSLAVFGRLRTGVSIGASTVGARGPERVGEAALARRQSQQHRRAAAAARRRRAFAQPAATAGYRRRTRAAGRVCERRQSGPRPRDRPGPGVRGPRGARLQPQPTCPAAHDRKPGPGGIRWHHRARAGGTRCERPPDARPRCATAARLGRLQPGRAPLRRGGDDGDGAGVWSDAGAAPGEERSEWCAHAAVAVGDRHAPARETDEAASPPRNSRSRWRSSPAPEFCR